MPVELMPPLFIITALSVFGALVGSFLNVCICRMPHGESVVLPSSHCTRCKTILKPIELVPVLSWLFLGGRCRYCGNTISIRYTIVEILTSIAFIVIWLRWGFGLHFLVALFIVCALIVSSAIDLQYQIIPDEITIPGLVLGFFFNGIANLVLSPQELALQGWNMDLFGAFMGALAGGGLLYALAYLSFGGMGGGDIKLMAMIGAFIGWQSTLLAILIASFIGAAMGIGFIVLGKKGRKDYIPFGPYLALGTALVMFFGVDSIMSFYLGLML